jgi:hypothetical protein
LPGSALAPVYRIGTSGWVGVSQYRRFWNTGRPNEFFPFFGVLGAVTISYPSRSMTNPASPLSRSASASQVRSPPVGRTFVGAGAGCRQPPSWFFTCRAHAFPVHTR